MSANEQHIAHVRCLVITLLTLVLMGMSGSQVVFAKTLKCALVQIEPFGFLTEDKQITGMHYDAMKRVVEEAGFTFKAELAPFARVVEQLKSGLADLAIMYRNEKIDKVAVIVDIFRRDNRNVVIGRPGLTYSSLDDLHGKRVAHLRGALYDKALAADEAIQKYYTTSYQHSLDIFLKKRVDAIVGPEDGILYATKRRGLTMDIFGEPLLLNTIDGYMFFSKKNMDEETLIILQKTLDRLRKAGVIEEIRATYVRLLSHE